MHVNAEDSLLNTAHGEIKHFVASCVTKMQNEISTIPIFLTT